MCWPIPTISTGLPPAWKSPVSCVPTIRSRAAWLAHSAELEAATHARLRRAAKRAALRNDVPTDVLQSYLDLVLDGLITRLASGQPTDDLTAVLDLVEESVRIGR